MDPARITPLVDEGLGNSSYLVDLGEGRALAVDPSRDLRSLRTAADRRGLRVVAVADTHLHADFLSGAVQLAADGAQVLASAAGRREFPHTGLDDADEVDLGGLTLQALGTPGHTTEHLAYALRDGSRTLGVFTGGSLLVGAAARTDLVDPELTERLARAQYRSLRRLAALADEVEVWPTHGAGSFCSAPPGAARTSTIGAERASNPLLRAADEDDFVATLLGSLGSFPAYFHWLAEVNRRGPAVLVDPPRLRPLAPDAVRRLVACGAALLDVRPVADVAAGHVPGSLAIPLRPAFATWLGWLVDPATDLIVVRNADQDPDEVAWSALKIGYERIVGELDGGLPAWVAADGPVERTPLVGPEAVAGAAVLDVRQDSEYAAGHVPGATHVELGSLAAVADRLPHEPIVVMCGHAERAMGAAGLLRRAGHRDVSVLDGGFARWAATATAQVAAGV